LQEQGGKTKSCEIPARHRSCPKKAVSPAQGFRSGVAGGEALRAGGGQAPGALHHITCLRATHRQICRSIERRNIFKDNTDRNRFLERLGSVLQKTSTPCYGWALIPAKSRLLKLCDDFGKTDSRSILVPERLETRNFNHVPFASI
jgi:hypothetical protein